MVLGILKLGWEKEKICDNSMETKERICEHYILKQQIAEFCEFFEGNKGKITGDEGTLPPPPWMV